MEPEQVVVFQLDYSEDLTITLIGNQSEVVSFLFTGERGGDGEPITFFALDEDGKPTAIPPQEGYNQQLRAIQEALSSDRGTEHVEDPVSEGILLPDNLISYLDELPEWLHPNVIRPVPGLLSQPALLPRPEAEEWTQGLASMQAITARYWASAARTDSAAADRGEVVGKIFAGFLIVDIKNRGVGCKQWLLSSHQQGSQTLHVYSFQSSPQNKMVRCKVSSGSANVTIDANGTPAVKPNPNLTPVDGWWPDANQTLPVNSAITAVVRNFGINTCAYQLTGGCKASGKLKPAS